MGREVHSARAVRTNLSAYVLKLLILITLVLMGGLVYAAIVWARAQDRPSIGGACKNP
ncbi:hypothetical protein ACWFRJ_31750 [Streptomyces sp. NPDC055239]